MDTTLTDKKLPPGFLSTSAEDLLHFNRDPYQLVELLKAKYGAIFTLRLDNLGNENKLPSDANGKWVFLSRPEHIEAMYKAESSTLSAAIANQIFFDTKEESLGYIEGELHRTRQSLLSRLLNFTVDYTPVIQQLVRAHLQTWPLQEEFSLFLQLQQMTTQVITTILCGNMSLSDREFICKNLLQTENSDSKRSEILAADANIRKLIEDRIDTHLLQSKKTGKEDLMTQLLMAATEDHTLTKEVIRDEMFSLLYTGFSTTANTLSWILLQIHNHEAVYQNMLAEIQILANPNSLTKDSIKSLHYCDAVIRETLRLHPVTALNGVRFVQAPITIGGYTIPQGTILVNCTYLLQRSVAFYDNPEHFNPERFIHKRPDKNTWTPFGGGYRTCIGQQFSLKEMKTVLVELLSTYQLRSLKPIPKAKLQGFFMAPENKAPFIMNRIGNF